VGLLIDISGEQANPPATLAHGISWHTQIGYCHPTWSGEDDGILYASDRDGQE